MIRPAGQYELPTLRGLPVLLGAAQLPARVATTVTTSRWMLEARTRSGGTSSVEQLSRPQLVASCWPSFLKSAAMAASTGLNLRMKSSICICCCRCCRRRAAEVQRVLPTSSSSAIIYLALASSQLKGLSGAE